MVRIFLEVALIGVCRGIKCDCSVNILYERFGVLNSPTLPSLTAADEVIDAE